MRNVYTTYKNGFRESFIDKSEPNVTFAISGSTRTNLALSVDATYNVLFNSSSMNMEEASKRSMIS